MGDDDPRCQGFLWNQGGVLIISQVFKRLWTWQPVPIDLLINDYGTRHDFIKDNINTLFGF